MNRENRQIISIYYCGHEKCESGHFFGPATRQHYLMHFILSGKGTYQVKDKKFEVGENQAFLIKPHEVTYYQADKEEPWEYVWIAFDGEEAERLLEKYGLDGDKYVCTLENTDESKKYLNNISKSFMKRGFNIDETTGYFYLIFSNISGTKQNINEPQEETYFHKAEQYIRYNYSYNIHVTDIARFVGLDRTYLFKIFKKHSGMSPKRYLTLFRINTAKEMLQNTMLTVTEIAFSCGFHDTSAFCKSFDKITGRSPLKYRSESHFFNK